MGEKHKCSGSSYRGRFGSGPCCNTGSIKENGQWYCKIHAPSIREAKRKKQNEVWDAKWEREAKERRQYDADAELGRMVRELVKHRGFATLAYRPYDGRWLVVFDFDPAKPFEGDTIDEAVKRAQERGT
jgi:hypothetical protein